ncbi:transcriptional regulator [Cladophialophora chaetospira]|uniref:Transcriptional regulator n=1 Tax=Cladophialophora chaetospira TaxID=386627 RepID=A0AA39CJ01_9EURO|nr:transcriptional regulator [Cladophialophora chaetospira]
MAIVWKAEQELIEKAGTWGQSGLPAPPQQTRDAVAPDSWAQAMGTRPTNAQLDLSASSFPSLNNTGLQSQNHAVGSSAWQTGPPQNEQAQRQQMQSTRTHLASRQQQQQQQQQLPGARDGFYPTDTYSRNAPMEFPSDTTSQPVRRASQAPGGPPGLTQRQPNPGDSTPQDPSRVTSPSGQTQISRSPISQSINAAIGQERFLGQDTRSQIPESPPQSLGLRSQDVFGDRDSRPDHDAVFAGMSEKDKFGMKGYVAQQDNASPAARSLMRGVDLSTLGINMGSQEPLLQSYPGPWAEPNAAPLRPLDSEYTIPDCYTVKKIASLSSRITGFVDETLFFIFYTMPRDYIQMLVAQELVARKWRYHMREKQWLTRDDASPSPVLLDDKVSEQGYYIWWDTKLWKKVRRIYTLRYEDLEEQPSMGNRPVHAGAMGAMSGGINGGMGVNAVPSLERMAASGRGF